jgi:hypothetical protein
MDPPGSIGMASWQQQQQCHSERHLELLPLMLLLLPAVLLPCASNLLSSSAQQLLRQQQQQLHVTLQQLLDVSNSVLIVGTRLHMQQGSLGWLLPLPPVEWVQEVLGVVLRLVGQLVHQQQVPTPASTTRDSSWSGAAAATRAACLARLLPLLCNMLHYWQGQLCQPSNKNNSDSSSSSSNSSRDTSSSDNATAAAAPEDVTFEKLGAAIEAVVRAVTAAVQSGMLGTDDLPLHVLSSALVTEMLLCRDGDTNSALMQHMGLGGHVVLAQEQRQLYSLLSTVLKLGGGESAGPKLCWGEQAAGSCCLAAGQAAVRLLLPPPTGSAAAATQQPTVALLPSLVIFGRCCLQWAEQLRQLAPEVLLLASGALEADQCGDAVLHGCSAAVVCIPGLHLTAVLIPRDSVEGLELAVSEWVGGLVAPAALAQLEAAGCAPQLLQQQLDTLLSAQQGTEQGLTDASLAAFVQQLQATGVMLCNIAVPHFCNNPACGNISGPTEVQLVSGRSCVCAGCCTARYCGRACQRAAWKQHKPVCKVLAATAAAAAAATGTSAAAVG